tara:strand:+ start:2528 stop:3583 length:1056 start_codon:yes stop_codon:yes gene_type:complete
MTILAGDLGGTKTLLAIYSEDKVPVKVHHRKYISAEWASIEPMIKNFLKTLPNDIAYPKAGCLAVAGRVFKGDVTITNLSWKINEKELSKQIRINQLELINDFAVLIYGLNFLNSDQYVEIRNQRKRNNSSNGVIAIIGAGTGLGIAKGFFTEDNIISIPSEGGHREFSPRSQLEWNLTSWLKDDLNLERLSIERIVSGTGLGHISRWLLAQDKESKHPLKEISDEWKTSGYKSHDLPALACRAAKNGDLVMKKAIDIWLSAYGSAAGDLALEELCQEGLWIAGGTAIKHLEGFNSSIFLKAMSNKGRFQSYIENLPLKALIDPQAGLFSAACRARLLLHPDGKLRTIERK